MGTEESKSNYVLLREKKCVCVCVFVLYVSSTIFFTLFEN